VRLRREPELKKLRCLAFLLATLGFLFAQEGGEKSAAPAEKSVEDQRRETLAYGTESEILALIQTISSEKDHFLDEELVKLAETSGGGILAGVFGYFAGEKKSGLEDRAIEAVREHDNEAAGTVTAAVNYLGQIRCRGAVEPLEDLILSGDNRFLAAAVRALGSAAGKDADDGGTGAPYDAGLADDAARFLLDYYENEHPTDETLRELITALGETGSKLGAPLLGEMIQNAEERAFVRMMALEAAAKIGDPQSLDAVTTAAYSQDPNVRAAAVAALYPFSGEKADAAVLEAFRDSYYRVRIAAARAAGKRRLAEAVPYLKYRAERDETPAVRDEAVRALGAIGGGECMAILDGLFSGRKNSDRIRLTAAEALVKNAPDEYAPKAAVEMDEAKKKNQTQLYNGFIRILGTAKTQKLEDLAARLLKDGSIVEKSLAIDLAAANGYHGLAEQIRPLTDAKSGSPGLARKAQDALETLGLK